MLDNMEEGSEKNKRARLTEHSTSHSADSGDEDGKVTKGTWCKEEDDRLLEAVKMHGTDNWKAVAGLVTGRSAKQCRDRYKLKLDPTINHGPWTKSEDDRLLQLASEYGRAWTKIARNMPGRTENAVKSRISSLERSKTKDWSSEEDSLLVDLRKKNVDFDQMVKYFPNRSLHSIKKRWETLHMDELAKKLRHDLNPATTTADVQNSSSSLANQVPMLMAQQSSNQLLSAPNGLHFPTMLPFSTQVPSLSMVSKPQASVHAGGHSSRLARHSTSMTVLLQVLGGESALNAGSGRMISPLREQSSFSMLGSGSSVGFDLGADGETPKQQLLSALGFFNNGNGKNE